LSQKGVFADFLTQHIQEIDDDEGNINFNRCYKRGECLADNVTEKVFLFEKLQQDKEKVKKIFQYVLRLFCFSSF
jgi:hypothetical protein